MSKVTRFEDLKCWQAARELVKEVYIICEEGKLAKDFETKAQLKKAALSTMNNIARDSVDLLLLTLSGFSISHKVLQLRFKACYMFWKILATCLPRKFRH